LNRKLVRRGSKREGCFLSITDPLLQFSVTSLVFSAAAILRCFSKQPVAKGHDLGQAGGRLRTNDPISLRYAERLGERPHEPAIDEIPGRRCRWRQHNALPVDSGVNNRARPGSELKNMRILLCRRVSNSDWRERRPANANPTAYGNDRVLRQASFQPTS
jgi:hypothetical protein